MKIGKWTIVVVAMSALCAQAEESPATPPVNAAAPVVALDKVSIAPDIKRESRNRHLPGSEVADKKLYVAFKDSPKMTALLQAKLRERGFAVAETEAEVEPEQKFIFGGFFQITGAGKEEVKGSLGELFEASIKPEASNNPNYRQQSVGLDHIVIDRLVTGSFSSLLSMADLGTWLGQKTGIAGRFNEMLTGDPRGVCIGDHCNKITSAAQVYVGGKKYGWMVKEHTQYEKAVLDLVVADSMEAGLKPLFDLKPLPASASAGNQ